ncbi:MAG: type II toxin-antitoxin system RelE/ParE family toxin [Alphaproteobacteria bacterium]|nr:type II toxin-antitoxin system RelE/ParE family toxin [Alphaproteobacteria bacterium]
MKLVVSTEAVADLERLKTFLADKDAKASERAATALVEAIGSLGNLPERGRPSAVQGLRELVVPFGQSAYVVRYAYRASTETVFIVRIWHGREDRP